MDPRSPLFSTADLGVAVILFASGALASRRRPASSVLLLAAGVAWILPSLWEPTLFWHRALLVHALIAYPGWRAVSRVAGWVIGTAYALCVLVPSAMLDDRVTVAFGATLVAAAWWSRRNTTGRTRHYRHVAWVASLLFGGVLMGVGALRLVFEDEAVLPAVLTYDIAVCAVGLGLVAGLRPPPLNVVTDLVIDFGTVPSDTLQDALARTLRDPDLRIGYWNSAAQAYLDTSGRAVTAPDGDDRRAALAVAREGRPLALLVLDRLLTRDPRVAASIEVATRMSAVNAYRTEEVTVQIRELEASRRRLIEAADAERGRLEQQLRAGIVVGLEALAADVGNLAGSAGSSHLKRARDHLDRTVEDLLRVSAGLRPQELDRGLPAALPRLAETSPVSVTVSSDVGPMPPSVELTVWYVCAEALNNVAKHAATAHVWIHLEADSDWLRLTVRDNGPGGAVLGVRGGLTGVRDRVSSLGGTFEVDSGASGTTLVAELPLGDQTVLGSRFGHVSPPVAIQGRTGSRGMGRQGPHRHPGP